MPKVRGSAENGPSKPLVDELQQHLDLLNIGVQGRDGHEISGTPVFTKAVLEFAGTSIPQWGFFAGITTKLVDVKEKAHSRLFYNISSPSSTFICGSQGSGKSHTLSCLLENCLMKSNASKLLQPLCGLVFHFDSFNSNEKSSPCEAAFLSSNKDVNVRVLCSPTNIKSIRRAYHNLPNVSIQPLVMTQRDLNTQRMMDLMAVKTTEDLPLYLHSVNRILRDMRVEQQLQPDDGEFDYLEFKKRVQNADLSPAQLAPLKQRLDTLESFMPASQTRKVSKKMSSATSSLWNMKSGQLTIVDLSCPCVTSESACSLFNICLHLFLDQQTTVGRIVALDEAHKFMDDENAQATILTHTLLTTIREQRHLGIRVLISTQEPTISPQLLDLCSTTIVHRFTSPDWYTILQSHLAGASSLLQDEQTKAAKKRMMFDEITELNTGEALLFSPSAMLDVNTNDDGSSRIEKLRGGYLRIIVRDRLTTDGGKSIMSQ